MSKEIERKFLVKDTCYRDMAVGQVEIRQGYISLDPKATVRLRIIDNRAFLTIKGLNDGTVRDEWEYPIPYDDAIDMFIRLVSGSIISKTRYIVPFDGLKWEVDEFHSPAPDVIVAEVELPEVDFAVTLPPFVGKEVTGNPAYYNSTIAAKN